MSGRKKFDDENFRERFYDLLRTGHGKHEACKALGIMPSTFSSYYKNNPVFREEVEEAIDTASEPILKLLYEEAKLGDWQAAKLWFDKQGPRARHEKETAAAELRVTHAIDLDQVTKLEELRARLEGRALPASEEVIDVEEVPDD